MEEKVKYFGNRRIHVFPKPLSDEEKALARAKIDADPELVFCERRIEFCERSLRKCPTKT
jgi:hypothetical protein